MTHRLNVNPLSKREYMCSLAERHRRNACLIPKARHYTIDPYDHESNERNDVEPIDTRPHRRHKNRRRRLIFAS
jgi:hypothetical protein